MHLGTHEILAMVIGSAAALVCTSAIAVLAGAAVTRVVSPSLLKRLAGFAFIAIGAWVLIASRAES